MSLIRTRFQLELEINGQQRYPIVQFGSDWSLNTIPSASCLLAVGRRMADGQTVSAAHKGIWSLRKHDKAKVYLRAEGPYSDQENWPSGELTIFDGRVDGVSRQTMPGRLFLQVSLKHWLAYLDSASALCASAHPDNPLQLSFSVLVSKSLLTGAVPEPRGLFQTAVASHFADNWAVVNQDIWGEGIKPMFCRLLSEKVLGSSPELLACIPGLLGEIEQPDKLEALKRIRGVSASTPACSSELPAYAPKLALDGIGSLPLDVVRALGNSIGNEMLQSFGSQSLWGKLLQYGSMFMFSVVPQVEQALVVPFTPLLRSTYCKTLEVSERNTEQLVAPINHSLRAVVAYSGLSSLTGLSHAIGMEGAIGMAGCFAPDGADPQGLVWSVPVPSWLANLRVDGFSTRRSTGMRTGDINSATTPMAIKEALKGREADKEEVFLTVNELFNGYAQTVFASEVLRGRAGRIGGKLRFDIAPGSIVRLTSRGDPFIVGGDLQDTLIGAVTGVSIGINAEASAAGTGFRLEYFRTEQENESDATSIAKHPLFTTEFLGAPLLDALQFGGCT